MSKQVLAYISCSLGRLENTFASITSKTSFCEISLQRKKYNSGQFSYTPEVDLELSIEPCAYSDS